MTIRKVSIVLQHCLNTRALTTRATFTLTRMKGMSISKPESTMTEGMPLDTLFPIKISEEVTNSWDGDGVNMHRMEIPIPIHTRSRVGSLCKRALTPTLSGVTIHTPATQWALPTTEKGGAKPVLILTRMPMDWSYVAMLRIMEGPGATMGTLEIFMKPTDTMGSIEAQVGVVRDTGAWKDTTETIKFSRVISRIMKIFPLLMPKASENHVEHGMRSRRHTEGSRI